MSTFASCSTLSTVSLASWLVLVKEHFYLARIISLHGILLNKSLVFPFTDYHRRPFTLMATNDNLREGQNYI